MRKQRAVLIKTNPDGTIKERYRVLLEDGFDPRAGYIELTDKRDKEIATKKIHDIMFKNGRVVEKPIVRVELDKGEILADGADAVKVSLTGVPEDLEKVDVKIGNDTHQVDPKEPFYVKTDSPQQLSIHVVTKTVKSDPVFVRATRKRVRIEDA